MSKALHPVVVDAHWTIPCRISGNKHWACPGLWEWPNDNGEPSGSFTRCVCACHDGFDPKTGDR
jgi:hypothetical protein